MERLTSVQNPKIRQLMALQQKSSLRREKGLFVVEGRREILHCIEAGFTVDSVFLCPEAGAVALPDIPETCRTFEVSGDVYRKMAYRESTEGIIAEVVFRQLSLDDLKLNGNPLVMVLESVEKPGNLGAVLRSADAAGVDAVIICDPLTDLFNPNLIRSSIGAVFTVPTVCCQSYDAICWLKRHKIKIITAQLQDSELYYNTDFTQGSAIVMGTESTGLTPLWRQAADSHIRIPMLGRLDSLNVSVSAAILMFEAVKQRKNG